MTARDIDSDGSHTALGNEHILALCLTIQFYNGVVRVLASLDIDVEDSYKPYLEQFPLPEGRTRP